MKNTQNSTEVGVALPQPCSVPRFDGPVRPPDGWQKMRGVRTGFRKWAWAKGATFVTHEKGKNECHLIRHGKPTRIVKNSPWGIMNWVNTEPQNAKCAGTDASEKTL